MPPDSEDYNQLSINFGTVHNTPPSDCSSPDLINTVIIKAGPDLNAPTVGTYCLNDLPESVRVPVAVARVEFYTVEADVYGFLANFNACKFNKTGSRTCACFCNLILLQSLQY